MIFNQAIAIAAVISNLTNRWDLDEVRPKIFAILNMLGVITKRTYDWPSYWATFPITSRCACMSGETDETKNECPEKDPCNPGQFPFQGSG